MSDKPIFECRDLKIEARPIGKDPIPIVKGVTFDVKPGEVVALIGDGCFQMTCGEIATARRMGLSLPVVVLVDDWLSLIQVKQHRRQMGIYGTSLLPEGYTESPAHYFGAPAVGVHSVDQLGEALREAFGRPGPTVIEAFVDSGHYMQTVFDRARCKEVRHAGV